MFQSQHSQKTSDPLNEFQSKNLICLLNISSLTNFYRFFFLIIALQNFYCWDITDEFLFLFLSCIVYTYENVIDWQVSFYSTYMYFWRLCKMWRKLAFIYCYLPFPHFQASQVTYVNSLSCKHFCKKNKIKRFDGKKIKSEWIYLCFRSRTDAVFCKFLLHIVQIAIYLPFIFADSNPCSLKTLPCFLPAIATWTFKQYRKFTSQLCDSLFNTSWNVNYQVKIHLC